LPFPLPDPYIVRGDPGQEYADGPGTQRDLEALAAAIGSPSESQGVVTLTWPGGGTFSDSMVVAHGLVAHGVPAAPEVVVATPNDINLSLGVTAITATTFTVQARDVNGTVHGLGPFGVARWIARL